MVRSHLFMSVVGLFLAAVIAGAADETLPPGGLVAASMGNEVVLGDPVTGNALSIPTGPVAWLFPAPGGVLFAPDLVNGRTTVIDLRRQAAKETIEGITMPHFGTLTDRYVVVSRRILVMSYPDRALLNRFEVSFERPWQVEVLADNTVLMVLERLPEGPGNSTMTAFNLSDGRLVYRIELGGDVRHFALSPSLGLMALADAESGQVVLADPSALTPVISFSVPGRPMDVGFVDDWSTLVVAFEREDGGGELAIWKIKSEKKKGLVRKKEWAVALEGKPIRMAVSPDLRYVAVGLANAKLQIVDVEKQVSVQLIDLPDVPRDVVWCDPSRIGPMVPEWTDNDPPTLNIGGR